MKRATISVCMIVKNEEKFLAGCLDSVKEIASEIIVTDTGSSDNTLEIAQKYGATVKHFEWCDDFAAARNASILEAKGDYILWLDADERLLENSRAYLKNLPRNTTKPRVYKVQINNHTKDSARYSTSTALRLFTRHKDIQFENRIHEQLTFKGQGHVDSISSPVKLEHLGYALDTEQSETKSRRNLGLLLKMVGERPKSAYAHFTLAQQYVLMKNYEEALGHFLKAAELKQFDREMQISLNNMTAECLLHLGRQSDAKAFIEKSLAQEERQVSGYFLQYNYAKNSSNWSKALQAIEKMRENSKRISKEGNVLSNDIILEDDVLFESEMDILFATKSYNEILARAESYSQMRENNRLLQKAAQAALAVGEWEKAITWLKRLIEMQDNPDYYDILATAYIKKQDFPSSVSVYESYLKKFAPNSQVIRRLAGLYVKTNKQTAAQELLARYNA